MRLFAACASLVLCGTLHAQISVVNGASFRALQPVSAGSWATAYGAFSGVSQEIAATLPIPKVLGGVTVTVDGIAAPVYFVSVGQINFIVPAGTTPGLRPIEVKTSTATVTGAIRVISSSPGIFPKDAAAPPKGAILNEDGFENTSVNVALRGRTIQIFGTGSGALDASVADGAAAPRNPLVRTKSTPQVYIGGVEAEVTFSGLAPDLPSVWQVNAVVPNQSFISGRVPVMVFMDGVDSNEVTLFVAQ